MKLFNLMGLGALALGLGACGDERASSDGVASVTAAVALISSGVAVAGTDLGGSATTLNALSLGSKGAGQIRPQMTADLCNENGNPKQASEGGTIDNGSGKYPGVYTYCAMTVTSGDTVRGGFALARNLICALEKGGLTFAGTEQTISVNFADTECWPDGPPGDDATGTISITATGSAPWSVNDHFEKGVVFTVNLGSVLTFSLGANISNSNIEFLSKESWDSGEVGTMAGSLDKATGALRFEQRNERVNTCSSSRCGWNRHTRIYAGLAMTGGEPSGLNSLEFAVAGIGFPPGQSGVYGDLVTASGNFTDGIKAKYFRATASAAADLKLVGNWNLVTPVTDTDYGCITSTAENATTCGAGISLFTTSTKFALYDTGDTHLTPAAWAAGFDGWDFTTIDLENDAGY